MSAELKFNVDDLNTQANKLLTIKDELKECSESLTRNLSGLRDDWQSEAGRAFFSNYDDSWVPEIEKQCESINDLVNVIKYAAQQYETVEDEFRTISF